ncbi:uncharacterized protein LOC106669625 isoform X3 [Cimex lectularius]|uniref:Uncharacterized protein n=1 Tax=Cimex lectularius TaxID=79782 RepID=A0A8I6SBU3_CIMLE|nr:uncharacterized protein LOC106669625 isoform X3 [Cimex lectularius]
MFSLSGKTGIIVAAAAALVGAASWFIGMKYWRDDEEEIEEGVVYDKQGDFMEVPNREIQAILGNKQLENVFYAAGPFIYKNGGLPAVHKALEDYGDVVERTKWYASAVKAGINPYL